VEDHHHLFKLDLSKSFDPSDLFLRTLNFTVEFFYDLRIVFVVKIQALLKDRQTLKLGLLL
jgi:hypothetical protein